MDYEEFLRQNRERVNHSLNKAVFACVLAGIGIFAGTVMNLWSNISYSSGIIQMILVMVVSIVMFLANKKYGQTYIPSVIGLLSLDLVLGFSANVHIGIYLSYFLVPLLAIAFCDKIFYLAICGMNYVSMFITVYIISDYYGSTSLHYYMADDPGQKWFVSHMMGYTLEYICMTIAGWYICKHITNHMKSLYDYQSKAISQFKVMKSATNIFDQIFYINDTNQTYVVADGEKFDYISRKEIEKAINLLQLKIVPADEKRFEEFVEIDTLGQRLKNKNNIEDTFYSVEKGYFSAMFIAISQEGDEEYIFCTRDVNEEKAKERTLNEMARRDQPTSLLNRRAYEEDFAAYEDAQNHNVAIVVVDINGLKAANDNLGHLAGDELILTAAGFLNKYFENMGKVYRVGGDEFHILVRNEQIDVIEARIAEMREAIENWKGKQENSLSISIGLASAKEDPQMELRKVQKLADVRMYEDKNKYYAANPELDRRKI